MLKKAKGPMRTMKAACRAKTRKHWKVHTLEYAITPECTNEGIHIQSAFNVLKEQYYSNYSKFR